MVKHSLIFIIKSTKFFKPLGSIPTDCIDKLADLLKTILVPEEFCKLLPLSVGRRNCP
jgi:hypothetical protein